MAKRPNVVPAAGGSMSGHLAHDVHMHAMRASRPIFHAEAIIAEDDRIHAICLSHALSSVLKIVVEVPSQINREFKFVENGVEAIHDPWVIARNPTIQLGVKEFAVGRNADGVWALVIRVVRRIEIRREFFAGETVPDISLPHFIDNGICGAVEEGHHEIPIIVILAISIQIHFIGVEIEIDGGFPLLIKINASGLCGVQIEFGRAFLGPGIRSARTDGRFGGDAGGRLLLLVFAARQKQSGH